jgi:hypothetical protein
MKGWRWGIEGENRDEGCNVVTGGADVGIIRSGKWGWETNAKDGEDLNVVTVDVESIKGGEVSSSFRECLDCLIHKSEVVFRWERCDGYGEAVDR